MVREINVVAICLACAGIVRGPSPRPSREPGAPQVAARPAADARAQNPFDARGRYLPTRDVTVKGYRLDYLDLSRYHATIQLSPLAGDSESVLIDCGRATITPDTLRVSCAGDAIGTLSISGAFLDKKGDFLHRLEEVLNEEVLEATVTYKAPGGTQSVRLRFMYALMHGL